MRMVLTSLILIAGMGTALAAPPTVGQAYDFIDPIFGENVLCDTADEVKAIATAQKPNEQFKVLYNTQNAKNEPTCAAGAFSVTSVVSVEPLGNMTFDSGDKFKAWVVSITVGTLTGAVLYLEQDKDLGI